MQRWRERLEILSLRLDLIKKISRKRRERALPLMSQGEAFGALALYAEESDAFTQSTIEQYTDLANNLAYGVVAVRTRVEDKRAEEALRASEQRLQACASPDRTCIAISASVRWLSDALALLF